MTEREYHQLNIDRYSSLKVFIEDRKKYWSKYILKEDFKEEKTVYTTFGSLVDCLLFSPNDFEDRFVLSSVKKPTAAMGKFIDCLWKKTVDCLSEDGIVTRSIDELLGYAYDDVAFERNGEKAEGFKKKKKEDFIRDFYSGTGAEFYAEQRESIYKSLVTQEDVDNALKVVESLRTNFATRDIINSSPDPNITDLDQVAIIFQYRGLDLKSLLDRVRIDHEKKTIQLRDLKTTFNVEEFDYNYIKYKYYIQAAVYNEAIKFWAEENGLSDYGILPMEFITCDSINYMNPLIQYMTEMDLRDAYEGFYDDFGRYYKGLNQVIDELLWHKETNIWNISRENYLNGGRRKIRKRTSNEQSEDNQD